MKRFLILLPALALGASAPSLHAQSSLTEQRPQTVTPLTELKIPGLPPVAPAKPFVFVQPAEKTLKNGLRVIFVSRPGLPLLTARMLIRSGAEADPATLPGLMSFTTDLLTRGAGQRTAPEIAEKIEELGGALEGSTGWDGTSLTLSVPSPYAAQAMPILADAVRRPTFAAAEVERARAQTLDAFKVKLQQPGVIAARAVEDLLFAGTAYGHAPEGTPTSIAALRRGDIAKLHAALFRPDNAVFIVAGDLAADDVFALAQSAFGDWKRGEAALPKPVAAPKVGDLPKITLIDMPQAGQAAVQAFALGIPRKSEEYFAGLVSSTIAGGGYSSRLNQEIRIKRGLSYGVNTALDTRRITGAIFASGQTKNASAAEVVQLMQGVFDGMATAPVGKIEFNSRQAMLTGAFARNLETNSGFVAALSRLTMLDMPLSTLNEFIPHVNAVTAEDVQKFAATHYGTLHYVIAGQGKTIEPTLPPLEPQFGKAAITPASEFLK